MLPFSLSAPAVPAALVATARPAARAARAGAGPPRRATSANQRSAMTQLPALEILPSLPMVLGELEVPQVPAEVHPVMADTHMAAPPTGKQTATTMRARSRCTPAPSAA